MENDLYESEQIKIRPRWLREAIRHLKEKNGNFERLGQQVRRKLIYNEWLNTNMTETTEGGVSEPVGVINTALIVQEKDSYWLLKQYNDFLLEGKNVATNKVDLRYKRLNVQVINPF